MSEIKFYLHPVKNIKWAPPLPGMKIILKCNAFTLVELLVTIAVISTLAAMLMTGISAALERAKETACLNNLKQIGYASMIYSTFSQDWLPYPLDMPDGSGSRQHIRRAIWHSVELQPDLSTFHLLVSTGALSCTMPKTADEFKSLSERYFRCPGDTDNFHFDTQDSRWRSSYIYWNYDSQTALLCDTENYAGKWKAWPQQAPRALIGRDNPGAVIYADPTEAGGITGSMVDCSGSNHPNNRTILLFMSGSAISHSLNNSAKSIYLMQGWARLPLECDQQTAQ